MEVNRYRQQQQAETFGLVGKSRSMRQLYNQIEQIARAEGGVLILGESGTGKELVAKAIHQASSRKHKPFLAINCAGIPAELMESEFFGHACGAFTGAKLARAGLLKEANGGSLLLDEIGEMPVSLQAKLLRVLQEGTMRPVGSDKEEKVDVRILAATHQDLEKRVSEGSFRADLFYRLETFSIKVPTLRQRGEDLELLAEHFLYKLKQSQPKQVESMAPEVLDCLYQYPFAGNVRELQNAIERAYTFCLGKQIGLEDLPERIRESASELPEAPNESEGEVQQWPNLQQMQQRYVNQVLTHTGGNKQQAAKILGITRRTLYRWLE
jgi:transcriptional regulator with PAS, ATPase and Fis domain